jgi:hypothetical protein
MVTYDSAEIYIESCTTVQAKIVALDAIIDALMLTAAKAAANDHITEYQLDDGQTKIRTMYNGAAAVFKSIHAYETLKQMYINKLNGRTIRLVDSKNLRGGYNGR